MPIDYQRLNGRQFDDIEHNYTARDTILYALSLGLGQDPVDTAQLRHVYEDGLVALPTMAVVLASPGFWLREPCTGVNWTKVLHGEQGLFVHRPLAPQGRVIGRLRIDEIVDKGPGRGALPYTTRDLIDAESGTLLCSLTSTSFLRGDGGFGGPAGPLRQPHAMPDRPPDGSFDWMPASNTALLYRLNGDLNPIHADPAIAAQAGFERPILHGLASNGAAAWAVLKLLCDGQADRLRRFDLRFTAPVYPGERLRTEVWRVAGGTAAFRVQVPPRKVVVLGNGWVEYRM